MSAATKAVVPGAIVDTLVETSVLKSSLEPEDMTGVVLFLAFSSPRWRNGLPGTMARPPKVERFPWAG